MKKEFNDNHEAALYYGVEQRWSVVKVEPHTKEVRFNWRELQERRLDAEEIQEIWGLNPDRNVGIITGKISGLVVVDFDSKVLGDSTQAVVDEFLGDFPTGLIASTPSGGYHLYYGYPGSLGAGRTKVPCSTGKLRPGVDVRADGGLVIAPPSYRAGYGHYSWVSTGTAAELPRVLLDRIVQSAAPGGVDGSKRDAWLSDVLSRGVQEGSRTEHMMRLGGYFLKKGIPEDVAMVMLQGWNEKNIPPIPDAEIEKRVGHLYRTRQPDIQMIDDVNVMQPEREESDPFLMSHLDFCKKYGSDSTKWLVEKWLPDHTVHFVNAKPQTYKTWLLHDLAVSVVTGSKFLGEFDVRRKGPVLWFQMEDAKHTVIQRLGVVKAARCEDAIMADIEDDEVTFDVRWEPLEDLYIHPTRDFSFLDPDQVNLLAAAVSQVRPVLCLIDPLYYVEDASDYFQTAPKRMAILKKLRDEFGTSFIIANHTTKTKDKANRKNTKTIDREEAFGSQLMLAFSESSWHLEQTTDSNMIRMARFSKSEGNSPEVQLTFHIDTTEEWSYDVEVGESAAAAQLRAKAAPAKKTRIDIVEPGTHIDSRGVLLVLDADNQESKDEEFEAQLQSD